MKSHGKQSGRPVPGVGKSCMGCLTTGIIVPLFAYVLAAPLSFHLGGRWTPTAHWTGVGLLQDSAGARYSLYMTFWAAPNIEMRNETTSCCDLSGSARVCTAVGATYRFTVNGAISGAWLRSDGAKVNLGLGESGRPKLPRTFQLAGVWRGPQSLKLACVR